MNKRNTKRNVQLAAAAALAAVLIAGQTVGFPVQADSDSIEISSMIPENVTIDEPVPLSEIYLPSSDYGTLSWADDSSVPTEHVQSYEVVFRPYDSSILSKVSGWDGESDAIYSSVTVVVSGMSGSSSDESDYEEEYDGEYSDYSEEEREEYSSEYSDCSEEQEEEYNDEAGRYTEEQGVNLSGEEYSGEEEETEEVKTVTSEESVPNGEEKNVGAENGGEGQSESSEVTKAAEEEDIPAVTEEPESTDGPEVTGTPAVNEEPVATDESEVTGTPAVTEEPEVMDDAEVTDVPEPTAAVSSVTGTPAADKDNIFDGKQENIEKDTRSDSVEENLTEEEQQARAAENHTCAGITVSGASLPWYVQFRVTSGESYQFSNESEANVFKSYEFELWDLKNNTEYEIPDGEYISVTVPVKAGYDYTIEHLLDSGATETIVPSVNGSTMVFSTHSFSPFGIAGSKSLTDTAIEDNIYVTATPVAQATEAASSSASDTAVTQAAEADTQSVSADAGEESYSGSTEEESSEEDTGNSVNAVYTGDDTPILPFVVLGIAAAAIICVIVYLRKRK